MQPLTMRQREVGGAGEGEKVKGGGRDDRVKGRPTGGSCSPSTIALLYLSTAFPFPKDRESRVFFLLCCYQEIIICCSVFHTDNQVYSEQQDMLHGGVKKKKIPTRPLFTTCFLYETLCWVTVIIGLQNTLVVSSICSARNQER